MKTLALSLLILAACQGGGSSSVTVIEEPPQEPTVAGSWGGTYNGERTQFLTAQAWPLEGESEFEGVMNLPTDLYRQIPMRASFDGEQVAGYSVDPESGAPEMEIWALLIEEDDETREVVGFLFEGFFVLTSGGVGSVRFRVIPPVEDE